jgi:hypothetical protein
MMFQIGQKVLCINDHFRTYCRYPLKTGSIYTIHGFYQCPCGSDQVTLLEIPGVVRMGCRCNRTSTRRQSYYRWRFIPLAYFEIDKEESSDEKEVLEEINASSKSICTDRYQSQPAAYMCN